MGCSIQAITLGKFVSFLREYHSVQTGTFHILFHSMLTELQRGKTVTPLTFESEGVNLSVVRKPTSDGARTETKPQGKNPSHSL